MQLQTQQNVTHGLSGMAVHVVKHQGVLGLYKGLSASILRQVGYGKKQVYSSVGSCLTYSARETEFDLQ